MTTTTPKTQGDGAPAPEPEVTFTIDGIEMGVPKGTLVIRAAEELGIVIPRFCDHPLLAPAGACRQCLVEVAMPDREGNLRPMPKPQASCTLEATPGMVVKTQHTSAVADKAQHGQIEFLLINHPLDCPTCDKGGECPLQNQALSNGRGTSRYHDPKRTFPKPLAISTEILLDRDRCILCQRCTRFADQIAGDHFIDLQGRGGGNPGREVHGTHAQQIGGFDVSVLDFTTADGTVLPYEEAPLSGSDGAHGVLSGKHPGPLGAAATDTSGRPFASYFSGNTIQICPVGALTGAAYRFRSRPFDLVSSPSIAEHDSSGAAIRIDHRRGVVLRRQAGDDPVVNEEWITDKDRFAYTWQGMPDRLTVPLVRDRADDGTRGELRPASWAEALELAAEGLAAARDAGGVGVLPGGRLPMEDAYAYAKFARVVLGTNDVDHRARPHSVEEEAFLAHRVAGSAMSVTFADLEKAPTTLLVAFEPEDEGGVVFLRLRKGVRARGNRVLSVAPFASRGLERVSGTLITAAPGTEPEVLDAIGTSQDEPYADAAAALSAEGAVILVGERLATVPGGLTAVLSLAERTGARLAWIPRRAGERGGVEVGTLPGLLPGGRQVSDAKARVDVAAVWDVADLPSAAGRSTDKIVAAAADGTLGGLLVGGVDPDDVADPAAMRTALGSVGFVVSLEVRASAVTALADVVLPVAPPVEKAGTFLNWEGRPRRFAKVLTSNAMADHRVLDVLADAMDVELGLHTVEQVRGELDQLAGWDGARARAPKQRAAGPAKPGAGQAVLATWHLLLDAGRCQDGERFLAGTAQRPMARIGQALAESLGVSDGAAITLRTPRGQITLPVLVTPMPDAVVWVPTQSVGSTVRSTLGVDAGAVVDVSAAALEVTETEERPVADDGEAQ